MRNIQRSIKKKKLTKGQKAVLGVKFAERLGLRLSQQELGTLVGVSPVYIGAAKRLAKPGRAGVIKGLRPLICPPVPKKSPPVAPVTVKLPPVPAPAAAPPTMVGVAAKSNGHGGTLLSDTLVDAVLRRAGPAHVRQRMSALAMT